LIDISNPHSLQILTEYSTPGLAHHCVVSGGYVYVADGIAGLSILQNGVLIGQYDTEGSTWDVKVLGNWAVLADGSGGLVVLDITDRTAPQYAGSYRTPGVAREIFLDGEDIYVADQYGLGVYRFTGMGVEPGQGQYLPAQINLSAYPNPFNGWLAIRAQLPFNVPAEISVYNISGQKLEQLYSGKAPLDQSVVLWNASRYSSGVYFLELKAGDFRTAQKVILQK